MITLRQTENPNTANIAAFPLPAPTSNEVPLAYLVSTPGPSYIGYLVMVTKMDDSQIEFQGIDLQTHTPSGITRTVQLNNRHHAWPLLPSSLAHLTAERNCAILLLSARYTLGLDDNIPKTELRASREEGATDDGGSGGKWPKGSGRIGVLEKQVEELNDRITKMKDMFVTFSGELGKADKKRFSDLFDGLL